VDIQNAWLDMDDGLRKSVEARTWVINEAVGLFRRKRLPIVLVFHTDIEKGPEPGAKEFEFSTRINIREQDVKVVRNYSNAFNRTELEEILRKDGCDTVMIAGLSATECILATYIGAIDRDFSPYLVRDGGASHREDYVRFVEEICDNLSVRALHQMLS
jgi:nicotinamidase-related amidase